MSKPTQNIAASIRQQLANHARESRQNFQTVLFRYGDERFTGTWQPCGPWQ